ISLLDESLSRNYVQQLLDEERVVVNDKKVKSSYKLKLNDVISVDVPEVSEIDAKPENIPLDILYEDKDIIVINKPKGMVVHPGAGNEEHTLVNALLYHCKDLSGINGKLRPGIVHRIDKDTTGCIVACKNDKAHEAIAEQLVDKTCHRSYLALVYGVIPHESGTIDAPIGRDGSNRQAMTVTDKNAREAVTHFDVVERFKDMTLVKCTLETGRTHQIRVHMRYIGYPVYGDPKYSKSKTDTSVGQYLHAYELALVHPTTGEAMKFSAPMPEYFEAKLKELRGEVIE
ncbi:MAG: RluA family pseudouridine synthase, partial [Erysipelotrichaceae bacterium]|nr:RluA family pseudouridine synthase [Erysipelotrichaceae bacterium]